MFGGLFKLVSSIIPRFIKPAAGFLSGLFKPSNIIGGLKKAGEVASKVGDVVKKVQTGIQVAKQLPNIGQKIQEVLEKRPGIEKVINVIGKGAGDVRKGVVTTRRILDPFLRLPILTV